MAQTSLKEALEEVILVEVEDGEILEGGFDSIMSKEELESFYDSSADPSLAGYECPTCQTGHDRYFSHGTGMAESVEDKWMRIRTNIEDEIVECENGFMSTKLNLLEYNAKLQDSRMDGSYLECPACEKSHEGEYKVVKRGYNCRDTFVMCPEGRIVPRDALMSYSHKTILERISNKTKKEVIGK